MPSKKTRNPTSNEAMIVRKTKDWKDFKISWQSYLERLGGNRRRSGYVASNFVYRGMGCSSQHLVSGFDRFLELNHLSIADPFEWYTQAIITYIEAGRRVGVLGQDYDISPDNPKPTESNNFIRAEAFAQQNGFPTRLLDWSCSPYIAAFFAATNSALCRSGFISIWALDKKETTTMFNREIEIIDNLDYENKRLVSQRGCFTRNETNLPNLDELFSPSHDRMFGKPSGPLLIRFDIPSTNAEEIVVDLEYMGIDFLSVYPDIEGVKEIARYKMITRG